MEKFENIMLAIAFILIMGLIVFGVIGIANLTN